MNITLRPGTYVARKSLTFNIPDTIEFRSGKRYLLTGDNGAGKSTFIQKLLLPAIFDQSDHRSYLFYIDQEFLLQFYAIKAHATFNGKSVGSYQDAIDYMYDVFSASANDDAYMYYVFDETEAYGRLPSILEAITASNGTIWAITHSFAIKNAISASREVEFRKIAETETEIIIKDLV